MFKPPGMVHIAMRDLIDEPRKFVVFVDSLGPDDVEDHTEFIREHAHDGEIPVGDPYVTPKVLGEIYTGKSPGEHGLPSVSRYDTEPRLRPAAPTLPEIVAEDDTYDDVCNFGLPFIVPPQVSDTTGDYWHRSAAMGNQVMAPPAAQTHLATQGPAGDISDLDVDDTIIFSLRQDHISQTFSQARSIAHSQDFDVVFISIRTLDEYCHHRFDHQDPSANRTDRQTLLHAVIDREIELLTTHGDVFVFGDHGATDLEHVFKINRWLIDNGYLAVEIDEDFREKAIETGLMDEPDGPGTVHAIGMPHVEIDEENSVAVSDDPFSGGITLLDGADEDAVEAMIEGLEATEYVDGVVWSRDVWEGDLLDEAPDLYCQRAVGTFISGNLAEDLGGAEITRSGVHHKTAAYGATTELETTGEITPQALHDVILTEFLGIEDPDVGGDVEYDARPDDGGDEEADRDVREHLRNMGYM